MKNNKQRLFEVMQKVNPTFKSKLNEDFNNIPPEYQIEFENLKKEYGDNVINRFFTSGLPGFYDSRTRGNYSLDAIKQNLNHLRMNEEPQNNSFRELMTYDGWTKEQNPIDSPEYKYYINVLNFVNGNNNVYEKAELIKKFQNEFLGVDYDILQTPAEMVSWWLSPEQQNYIKSELGNEEPTNDVMNEAQGINRKYTHFAVAKNGKIVNGWDYKGVDPEELKSFKKDYFFNDIIDMGIDPKSVAIYTAKTLQKKGINPFDQNNWINI